MPYLTDPIQLVQGLALVIFVLGVITFATGVVTLYRAAQQPFANAALGHAARTVRKAPLDGISESLAQANSLLNTISALTQTNRGIGVILLFTGMALMAAGTALLLWLNGNIA